MSTLEGNIPEVELRGTSNSGSIVYRITDLEKLKSNTPPFFYIGSKKNWFEGCDYWGSSSNKELREALRKDPSKENFLFDVLSDYVQPANLLRIEREWHIFFDVVNSPEFYNRILAGEKFSTLGKKLTEETKRLIGEKSKGRVLSSEAKLKISKRLKGRKRPAHSQLMKGRYAGSNNPMFGKGEKIRGIKRSAETKEKLSIKAKINSKGENNPRHGIHLPLSLRNKIATSVKKTMSPDEWKTKRAKTEELPEVKERRRKNHPLSKVVVNSITGLKYRSVRELWRNELSGTKISKVYQQLKNGVGEWKYDHG